MSEQTLTPEEVAKQIADLKTANEKLASDHKSLQVEHEKQVVELQAANKKLSKDNQTISAENQKLIKGLSATQTVVEITPGAKVLPKLPTQRVVLGMKEYAFQVPVFYNNGFYYTAEELVADSKSESAQKVLADLLKIDGQGILKEIK